MVLDLHFILGALLALLIIAAFVYAIEWFLVKGEIAYPRPLLWLGGLIVWLLVILSGGIRV